ncbi:MAG TPA: hypothetical protein VFS08_11040 [Gemmatimonadaceae bacterium]|nr:hypothetical protein [Gemmatimonadaceae bacterium]
MSTTPPASVPSPHPGSYSSPPPSAYDVLLGEVDRILGEWRQLVATEPWSRIPRTRLIDTLPEILPRLFRLARDGAEELDVELRELVAASHGTDRRRDGLPLRAVADEWTQMQHACWLVLHRNQVSEDAARAALDRLDLLIDDAIGFTLRGYYTAELDALRGRGLDRRAGPEERRAGESDRRR